jgi:dihydrofolate synthase/folylpolyglutamate synthase
LGGRLDATNVVKPKVSIITKIGYDHTNLLGKTLTKISQEKAGIIHPSSFVVIAEQRPAALKIIKARIKLTKSNSLEVAKAIKVKEIKTDLTGTKFYIKNMGRYKINLIGRHQIENACTALAVLFYLQKQDQRISDIGIRLGLQAAHILARCQIVSEKPFIMVDGAHNPESVRALYHVIRDIIKKKVIIVFGASQGKLVKNMFKILTPVAKQFILTQSENPRSIPSSELANTLKPLGIPFKTTNSVSEALKIYHRNHLKSPKLFSYLVITGSFYVASEAIMYLKKSKSYKNCLLENN